MKFKRSSGILLHISSLPSYLGIGDLGPSAYKFIDFLRAAGQSYWQVLPLNPIMEESGNSPYSSPSAFAGNILFISPELLIDEGLLQKNDLKPLQSHSDHKVNFSQVFPDRIKLLNKAYSNWEQNSVSKEYEKFCSDNSHWLNDYVLYISLRNHYSGQSWNRWPQELQKRNSRALDKAKKELAASIEKEKFLQFLFFQQWEKLKEYAHSNSIQLIGDMPFYVNYDSADCWANPGIFKLDDDFKPSHIAGVPPDYFSETGQLWGNPVFNWSVLKEQNFAWWINRIQQNLKLFDVLRLDHFRAFAAYWEVPANEKTAENGEWKPGPGTSFFEELKRLWPKLPFIAEDLGTIDKAVTDLLTKFNLSGMRVLQFAFGDDFPKSPYIPHNHIQNCLVCTGTHDNPPVRWWYKKISRKEKKNLWTYLDKRIQETKVAGDLQRLALKSVANLAVIPMQDILNLGEEGMMNQPGTGSGNWEWKMREKDLSLELASELHEMNRIFNRLKVQLK